MTGQVWWDGALVDPEVPRVAVDDRAFTVGDAVFETMKVTGGRAFALTRHLRRLSSSAAGLGLPAPDDDAVRDAITEVLGQPEVPGTARVRVTYGGGRGPMGSARSDAPTHLSVVAADAPTWSPTAAVATVPWVRNERSAVAGLKTTSYAENVVALERARAAGASEALLANTRGELCEGTGSNVFVVLGGRLLTPPLDSGCLPGITRELVLEWCRLDGLTVAEAPVPWSELDRVEEMFLTSSTRDVQPVHAIDGRVLAGGAGPVTQAVVDVFVRRAAQTRDP